MELWPDEGVGGVGFDRRGGRRRVPMGVQQRAGQPGRPYGAVEAWPAVWGGRGAAR